MQNTSDNSTDNTLTFSNGDTFTFSDTVIFNGRDADDRILIVSDSPGNAATLNVVGGSVDITLAEYLTVTDNILQDNGATMSPELDPSNSTNGGNTAGWFSAANVEFSTATASSTDEATADNFPSLFINGVVNVATSVDVDVTGGGATNGGTDYTMTDPLTVNIPAATYDGTAGTAISITAPTLNQDSLIEGDETITLSLINFGAGVQSGDADSSTVNESTHTYTITDDDTLTAEFSAATSNSPEATGTVPTLTVSGGQSVVGLTVEVARTGGTATLATDFTFTSPETFSIPAADYTTPSVLSITGLAITDEGAIELDETIDFLLQNPSLNVALGAQTTNTYTITNDDVGTVSVSVSDAVAAENPSDNGEFTVTLSSTNSTGSAITVNYSVSGTATAGTDYVALSGSTTIADGAYDRNHYG